MTRIMISALSGLAMTWAVACDKSSRDAGAFTSAGVTHLQQGQYDRAIRDFDRALAIRPGMVVAWRNRGLAHRNKGDFERAIADYDQAILLAPGDARLFTDRGLAYLAMSDDSHAIQDFDRAVALKPDLAPALEHRGRAHFLAGNLAQAAADLQRGLSFDSTNASVVLWLHLARARLKQDDASDFAAHAASADTTQWPMPVVRYFLGTLSADQLRALAAAAPLDAASEERCDVPFFLAEDALLRRKEAQAKTLLAETRSACPRDVIEHKVAIAEQQRLAAAR